MENGSGNSTRFSRDHWPTGVQKMDARVSGMPTRSVVGNVGALLKIYSIDYQKRVQTVLFHRIAQPSFLFLD